MPSLPSSSSINFRALIGAVTLKLLIPCLQVGEWLGFPRLNRRGHIEALVGAAIMPNGQSFPRLNRRGHIEASDAGLVTRML